MAMDARAFFCSVGALLHSDAVAAAPPAAPPAASSGKEKSHAGAGASAHGAASEAPPAAPDSVTGKKGRGRKRKEPPEGAAPQDEPTRAQERLVKNRMSAARSRERKLAYTSELEHQLASARDENDKLRAALRQAGLPLPAGVPDAALPDGKA